MADHRFAFKAEFEMHGVKREINLAWCNWGGGRHDFDSRITAWLSDAVNAAMDKYDEEVDAYMEKQRAAEREKHERAEYERLRTKFEGDKQ